MNQEKPCPDVVLTCFHGCCLTSQLIFEDLDFFLSILSQKVLPHPHLFFQHV